MNNKFLICIFNYRHDNNAKKLLSALSPYFDVYVLDSGNKKEIPEFILFKDNIYYSGLFNEMKKLSTSKHYDWVGLICSDVLIDNSNIKKLISSLNLLKYTKNIGLYLPSFDKLSYNWRDNIHNENYKLEGKYLLDGPILFMNNKVLKKFPYIDTTINLYGWAITRCISALSTKLGYYNVFDNIIQVTHKNKSGYSQTLANSLATTYIKQVAKELNINIYEINRSVNLSNSLGDITNMILYKNNYMYSKMKNNSKEKLIVSLTTWKKRINNIPIVLTTILSQTKKPDKIVLNLSSEEFKNKEKEFSDKINKFLDENKDMIIVNWVDGPNIKLWKKIIPTFKLFPNDCIVNIDDDFIYPNDMLETFWNMHMLHPQNPLSGNRVNLFGCQCHCGCASLTKLEYFDNIFDYINDNDLCNMYSSDIFYTYVANKSNHPYIHCGKLFFNNMKTYNDTNALSSNNVSSVNAIFDTWNYLVSKYGKLQQLDVKKTIIPKETTIIKYIPYDDYDNYEC